MKRPIKILLIPALLIAGLIVMVSDQAEAHRRFRRLPARVVTAPRHFHRVYAPVPRRVYVPAPPVVRVVAPPLLRVPALPPVHVHAPGVHVDVAPWTPWHGPRGSVVAPGVHVQW